MWKEYKETFDGVHASQRLKTEVMNMKREENAVKKRRIPAAALVAAVLVIALAGTALAVELISRVEIQMVDPSEADEFDVGYTAYAELAPLPLEALSEEARERAAGMTEFEDWAFYSRSEAVEFFGLDLAENPVLAQMRKDLIIRTLPDGTLLDCAYCRAGISIDPETPGVPDSIYLRTGYERGKCSITENVRIKIDSPGQSEPHGSVTAGLFITGLSTLQLQTETYVTPSGMEVSIVTHEVNDTENMLDFIDYTAYFVKDGFYYYVVAYGGDNAMDILKEVLDAYE